MSSLGEIKRMVDGSLSLDSIPATDDPQGFLAPYLQPESGDFVLARPGGDESMSVGLDGELAFANYNKGTSQYPDLRPRLSRSVIFS